jgi:hypothetical protein
MKHSQPSPILAGLLSVCTLLAATVHAVGATPATEPFEAFLTAHCSRCHGADKSEGELRIDQLSRDFRTGADTHRWAEVLDRINAGEMPPEPEPKPAEAEIAAFVAAIDSRIREGRAVRMAARPAVAHYRLSRKEYQNTVHDLLGVHYDPAETGGLNADTLWHGYERIGSELSLSPSHVDRYYRAAERVLDRAFPAVPSVSKTTRKTAAELHYGGGKMQQELLDRFGIKRPLRWVRFPGSAYDFLGPHKIGNLASGWYRVRIQASGIRPTGSPPAHLRIGRKTDEESVEALFEFDVTAPEDKPEVYESEVFLEMPQYLNAEVVSTNVIDRRRGRALRSSLESRDHIFTHSSEPLLRNPSAPQLFDDKSNALFHCVLVDWVELEGPLETDDERSRRAGVLPPQDADAQTVAEHLRRFAERAWRRPVRTEELDEYMKAWRSELDAGEKPAAAYRAALLGVLTSRNFIYVVEGDPSPDGAGPLELCRGIEVGHIFQLRTRYSQAMKVEFIDEAGQPRPMEMGCYGIGVSRIVGAAIEQGFDERGIVFPPAIAPFEVAITPIGLHKSEAVRAAAESLYAAMKAAGIDVLLDDRDERPGAMFADMELIGVPHRIVLGDRGLAKGECEYKGRRDAQPSMIPLDGALAFVMGRLGR